MKKFRSVALDAEGKKYAGTFEAESHAEALRLLAEQGFQVQTLEEVSEVEAEVENTAALRAKAALKKEAGVSSKEPARAGFVAGKARGAGIWKTLGIGAAVLGGIPLIVYVFVPRPPVNTPESVVTAYYQCEIAQDYACQHELFSQGMLMLTGDLETYTGKRASEAKRAKTKLTNALEEMEGMADETVQKLLNAVPVLAGVEKRSQSDRDAEAAAFLIQQSSHEEYAVKLSLEGREWKIKSLKLVKRKDLGQAKTSSEAEEPEEEVKETREKKPPAKEPLETRPPEPQDTPAAEPASSGKVNMTLAKQQAVNLLDEALERGVITKSEYQTRKKQLGA